MGFRRNSVLGFLNKIIFLSCPFICIRFQKVFPLGVQSLIDILPSEIFMRANVLGCETRLRDDISRADSRRSRPK